MAFQAFEVSARDGREEEEVRKSSVKMMWCISSPRLAKSMRDFASFERGAVPSSTKGDRSELCLKNAKDILT